MLLVLAGCGGGSDTKQETAPRQAAPTRVDASPPPGLSAGAQHDFTAGKALAESSGCLACHQIGRSGSGGPGPDLSSAGARLADADILAVLRGADHQPYLDASTRRHLDTLVAFVSELRRPPSARNSATGPAPLGAGMLSLCCS